MKHHIPFMLMSILSFSLLFCMKQDLRTDEYEKWHTYYKSKDDPVITDACFIPTGHGTAIATHDYEIAITTHNDDIRIFRPFDPHTKEGTPLKGFVETNLIINVKDVPERYIKNIFYSKGSLFVLTNSNLMTGEQAEKYTNNKKSQWIQDMGVMQNKFSPYKWTCPRQNGFFEDEVLLFFDTQSGLVAAQKNDKSAVRLRNISYVESEVKSEFEIISYFLHDKEETITSAAYNEKKRLCAFAITNCSFKEMIMNRDTQYQTYHGSNQTIFCPSTEKYLILASCKDSQVIWGKSLQASHCTFNEEGSHVAYYAPEDKKVYVSDTSNGANVYKLYDKINIESLIFDECSLEPTIKINYNDNNETETRKDDKSPLELAHYNDDGTLKMIVTPKTVTIYRKKEQK